MALLVLVPGLTGQELRPLPLSEALRLAAEGNADLGAARAHARAAHARARAASSFLWPGVEVSAGARRTDDPVAAFGTKLRQGRFREVDFGLDALNHPSAVNDVSVEAGLAWEALNPAAWTRRGAAREGAVSADMRLERAAEAVAFQTRVLYLESVRLGARLAAVEAARDAAEANARRIRMRRAQGVLTDADVLRVDAEAQGARAAVTEARRMLARSRTRLAVHLGWSGDVVPVPTDTLILSGPPATLPDDGELRGRWDLQALEAERRAADARLQAASRARLPTLRAFAGLSSHAPDVGSRAQESWTVGVRLQLPVFTGFGISAAVDEARAMENASALRLDEARRRARAEVADARRGVESGIQAMGAAMAASSSAEEAVRLVRRRFEEGMATTADLLQAEGRAAALRSRAIDAAAAYRMALAELDFALGVEASGDLAGPRPGPRGGRDSNIDDARRHR